MFSSAQGCISVTDLSYKKKKTFVVNGLVLGTHIHALRAESGYEGDEFLARTSSVFIPRMKGWVRACWSQGMEHSILLLLLLLLPCNAGHARVSSHCGDCCCSSNSIRTSLKLCAQPNPTACTIRTMLHTNLFPEEASIRSGIPASSSFWL